MKKITLNDPESKSADVVAANIEQLKSLFPEAFTEGKVDFEVLKGLLGGTVDEREEKYGLNWHGKRRARQIALTPSTGTLRPCPEESVDWDTTQNLMIEGDNLEVLKLLQKSYAGKVKLIYIDPPYNTGKDFVYPDNFQDNIRNYLELTGLVDGDGLRTSTNTEASGRFHTNWLNMMYPRLKLGKNLLADDGLIMISCDDNENGNLRSVCDEIFGEENFKGQISRSTGTPTGQGTDRLVNELDYIVVYSRTADAGFIGLSMGEQDAQIYDQEDERGRYLTRPLRKTGGEDRRADRPSMYFPVTDPDGDDVFPIGPGGYESRWRCGKERYAELLAKGFIEWKKVKENGKSVEVWKPYQKFYLEGRLKLPSNLWTEEEGNKKATRELKDLFGERVFDFPKPTDLLQRCLQIGSHDEWLIIDFFAGSGTMGHAFIAQNSADGGSRRYIVVQFPESLDPNNKEQKAGAEYCDKLGKPRNIAEITKERLRRAGKKIQEDNPMFTGDFGFRVFKLDSSNIRAWDPDRDDLSQSLLDSVEHLKAERSEQDILFELLLKLGLELTVPIEQRTIAGKAVHSIGVGSLLVCLAPKISREEVEPLAHGIVSWRKELAPAGETQVVFRDSAFADDVAKSNLTAILRQYGLENARSLSPWRGAKIPRLQSPRALGGISQFKQPFQRETSWLLPPCRRTEKFSSTRPRTVTRASNAAFRMRPFGSPRP